MRRIFHQYKKWECYKNGMWKSIRGRVREKALVKAIEFTGNAEIYGLWMLKVIEVWPITCEHHLTETGSNRKAFIGHAAVCFAFGCPEDVTRQAWGHLTKIQQDEANHKAEIAISAWEKKYNEIQNRSLLEQMDYSRLQPRHSKRSRSKVRVDEQGSFISCDL